MKNDLLYDLASRQRNRVAHRQLRALGFSQKSIQHRLARGQLILVHDGVYALPPLLTDDWSTWQGVTLTAPNTFINRLSAACAWTMLEYRPPYETVVRPGTGGHKTCDGIVIYRSATLEGETTVHEGIPITSAPRTLLDLACFVSENALARALREAIRLRRTTMWELGDYLGLVRARQGAPRLARAIARYEDLPLERARSGAEIRAMELLRNEGYVLPRLNVKVAGEESDLSWPQFKLIIEIDGGPFHLDKGEDARKEAAWRSAGWEVKRIPSDDVYDRPGDLLLLAPKG